MELLFKTRLAASYKQQMDDFQKSGGSPEKMKLFIQSIKYRNNGQIQELKR